MRYIYIVLIIYILIHYLNTSNKKKISKIGLLVSFSFQLPKPHMKEILDAIRLNSQILPIHILLDGPRDDCTRMGFHCTYFGPHQPSYYDMIKFAAELPHDFVILSNADILFDRSIYLSLQMREKQAYAISWSGVNESMCLPETDPYCKHQQTDWVLNCWPKRLYSIDSFVFRRQDIQGVTKDGFVEDKTDKEFVMNRPAAEFSFIGAMQHQFNIDIHNACRFITSYHHHESPKSYENWHLSPLVTKYGIYRPGTRKMVKKIIYRGFPKHDEFKLPIGV